MNFVVKDFLKMERNILVFTDVYRVIEICEGIELLYVFVQIIFITLNILCYF